MSPGISPAAAESFPKLTDTGTFVLKKAIDVSRIPATVAIPEYLPDLPTGLSSIISTLTGNDLSSWIIKSCPTLLSLKDSSTETPAAKSVISPTNPGTHLNLKLDLKTISEKINNENNIQVISRNKAAGKIGRLIEKTIPRQIAKATLTGVYRLMIIQAPPGYL
jgi:hypothetical protein